MRELWPDTFVEESNLAQNISLLRKALSEETAWLPVVSHVSERSVNGLDPPAEPRLEQETTGASRGDGLLSRSAAASPFF